MVKSNGFYTDLPNWSKVLLQLGFAGVIAVLFVSDSRERSHQLRDMQTETRQQARDDRLMFREEMKAQRDSLSAAVNEMKRAIDTLSDQHKSLKKDVDDIRHPFAVPSPREKP